MRVLLELGFGLPKKAQVVKPTCTIVQLIALIDERYGEDLFATVSSLHINDHILEAHSDDDLVVDAIEASDVVVVEWTTVAVDTAAVAAALAEAEAAQAAFHGAAAAPAIPGRLPKDTAPVSPFGASAPLANLGLPLLRNWSASLESRAAFTDRAASTHALHALFVGRIAAERRYASDLLALSSLAAPKDSPTLADALARVRGNLVSRATLHADLASSLARDIAAPMEEAALAQAAQLSHAKSAVRPRASALRKAENLYARATASFAKRERREARAVAAYSTGRRSRDFARAHSLKACEAFVAHESAWMVVESTRKAAVREIEPIVEAMCAAEARRVAKTKDCLRKYVVFESSLSANAQYDLLSLAEDLNAVDPEADREALLTGLRDSLVAVQAEAREKAEKYAEEEKEKEKEKGGSLGLAATLKAVTGGPEKTNYTLAKVLLPPRPGFEPAIGAVRADDTVRGPPVVRKETNDRGGDFDFFTDSDSDGDTMDEEEEEEEDRDGDEKSIDEAIVHPNPFSGQEDDELSLPPLPPPRRRSSAACSLETASVVGNVSEGKKTSPLGRGLLQLGGRLRRASWSRSANVSSSGAAAAASQPSSEDLANANEAATQSGVRAGGGDDELESRGGAVRQTSWLSGVGERLRRRNSRIDLEEGSNEVDDRKSIKPWSYGDGGLSREDIL